MGYSILNNIFDIKYTIIPDKEKIYLWETGPKSMEDYNLKQKLQNNSEKYQIYLNYINHGIYIRPNLSKHLCINYTDKELERTENVFTNCLKNNL